MMSRTRSPDHSRSLFRRFASSVLGFSLVSAAACGFAPDRTQPNIVLIIIDTLRADRLGAYGFDGGISPELDAYARAGVRFDLVVAQNTWTRPSIASMLTSLHPRTLGIYNERGEILGDRFVTLAEVLKRHGYTTFGITANPNINSHFNFHQGFDRYVDSDVVMEWMATRPDQDVRGEGGRWLSPAREIFRATLEALDTLGDRPHFVQINLMDVHEFHDPRVPAPDDVDVSSAGGLTPRTQRYLRGVRIASREIDRFIRELTARPGWDPTLFAITSDHGETLDDHAELNDPKWHGYLVYESQVRVPLILYSSDGSLPAGRTVRRPVRLLDVMPTLLDYAGAPVPDGIEGVSLRPLVDDPAAPVGLPEAFVVETRFREAQKLGVYTSDWKYIENRDGHEGTNPRALQPIGTSENGARTDVAAQHPAEVERLAEHLRRWEEALPPAKSTFADRQPAEQLRRQLQALGYAE
jgi:arylsulfatase A-like enzyme